jgi:hypothetical protein
MGLESSGIVGVNAVAVEKGTKTVISANFSVFAEPSFNDLRTELRQ